MIRSMLLLPLVGAWLSLGNDSKPTKSTEVPLCVASHDWAVAHKDELPNTLEGLRAFPVGYRRAIIAEMSADTRTRLWDAHLTTYLTAESRLSAKQKMYVDSVRRDLPHFFATVKPNAPELKASLAAAIRVLGKQHTAEIFGTLVVASSALVPNNEPTIAVRANYFVSAVRARRSVHGFGASASYAAAAVLPAKLVSRSLRAKAMLQDDCNCSTIADFCNSGNPAGPFHCTSNGCVIYSIGCGFLGYQACNGSCPLNES